MSDDWEVYATALADATARGEQWQLRAEAANARHLCREIEVDVRAAFAAAHSGEGVGT